MALRTITRRNILTHLFFITFFLVVPTLAFVHPPGEPFFAFTRVFVQDTIANFILLGFFYINYYVFIPKFYFKRRYVLYVLYVVLFLSLTFMLPHLITDWLQGAPADLPPHLSQRAHDFSPPRQHLPAKPPPGNLHLFEFSFDEFRRHLYLFFTAVFFSFLLRTNEHLSLLKEEKLNAELSSLKAKINPHFLFNTLNSIYALSVKKDDRASEAIIHLSGLMRYAIKDAQDYKIPLPKEIDYIRNYIELQKARLGNTTDVRFACSSDVANKEIAPLILITYIENAFKYGINPDIDDCVVDIKIEVADNKLVLVVFNKKVPRSSFADSAGIGMENTGERLKHLYSNKHTLQVNETKETYCVTLTLELT